MMKCEGTRYEELAGALASLQRSVVDLSENVENAADTSASLHSLAALFGTL